MLNLQNRSTNRIRTKVRNHFKGYLFRKLVNLDAQLMTSLLLLVIKVHLGWKQTLFSKIPSTNYNVTTVKFVNPCH
jgi:hypothetical protein